MRNAGGSSAVKCGPTCSDVIVVVVSNLSFTSYDGNMPINEDAK